MFYIYRKIEPQQLSLEFIVSQYTCMRRDSILFELSDMNSLIQFCMQNDIFISAITRCIRKFDDIMRNGAVYNAVYQSQEFNIQQVKTILENDPEQKTFFECNLRKYTEQNSYENIDVNNLPLSDIVQKYHVSRRTMTLFDTYNMGKLINYCQRNNIYILSIEQFMLDDDYTQLGKIYCAKHLLEEGTNENSCSFNIDEHTKNINDFMKSADDEGSYFNCLLGLGSKRRW